jgi:hypothetical protein
MPLHNTTYFSQNQNYGNHTSPQLQVLETVPKLYFWLQQIQVRGHSNNT